MLIVDVIVLLSNTALRTLLELVLTVSGIEKKKSVHKMDEHKNIVYITYILTSESFDKTAITLFNSLGWRPILPAKSSSLRLQQHQKASGQDHKDVKDRDQALVRMERQKNRKNDVNACGTCLPYLHWMPCKLVHDDGVFWLIEGARYMLYKKP